MLIVLLPNEGNYFISENRKGSCVEEKMVFTCTYSLLHKNRLTTLGMHELIIVDIYLEFPCYSFYDQRAIKYC